MSLNKVLIDWCNEHIRISKPKYAVYPPPPPKREELTDSEWVYSDCTGASGYESAFAVYLMPNGSYKVTYCDSYTDEPCEGFPERVAEFKDIKEAIMFVTFHGFDWSATPTSCLQMLLNNTNTGYKGKREDVKNLQNSKRVCLNPDEPLKNKRKYGLTWTLKYDKDYLLKKLNIPLDISKCKEIDNYYFPDLTKCDDTDEEFISIIKKQINNGKYDIAD